MKTLFKLILWILSGLFGLVFGRRLKPFESRAWAIDGDTLGIPLNNGNYQRVRIIGIDAPEMRQKGGRAAKAQLETLVAGSTLAFRPTGIDRYGRILARVFDAEGRDLGQAMVCTGYARASIRFDRRYARDMRRAMRHRAGLWAQGGIADPAAFRALHG